MQILGALVAVLAAGAAVGLGSACGDSTAPKSSTSTGSSEGGTAGGPSSGGGDAAGVGGGGSSSTGGGATGPSGAGGQGGGLDTCGIGASPGGGGAGGSASASGRVRVVAANLSSGDAQSYDGGQGVRILQGLEADVILLQEMNFGTSSPDAIGGFVDEVCEGRCKYVRGPQEQIPNGVLSRLPILACGSWVDPEVQNRNFVWARIDVPGAADLWAISVHLLTSGAGDRAREAAALLDHLAEAIPSTDLIVLGGDLNTDTRNEAALTTLSALFETEGPHPVDQVGNGMTNATRDKPYDWVLADTDLFTHQVPVELGVSSFPSGAVIDTRVHEPLSDLAPALQSDSGAPSMQHMAVVKDFELVAPSGS